MHSDLSLLEIGAGHFARLEFATHSEISLSFVKDMAAFARTAVKHATNSVAVDGAATNIRNMINFGSLSNTADVLMDQNFLQKSGRNQEVSPKPIYLFITVYYKIFVINSSDHW